MRMYWTRSRVYVYRFGSAKIEYIFAIQFEEVNILSIIT
jgi:hypothetical protein